MRIVFVFINILLGLALQACYLNAKIDSLASTSDSLEPEKLNPASIQVSSTDVILQEQNTDVVFNSEITLTLNQKYSKPITVNLTLIDIYAQNVVDYSVNQSSFVIAPGELSKSIPVLIKGDLLGEGSETFKIQISLSDTEVALSAYEVSVTILDNDPIVLQVASLYPNMGSNFLDYVENIRTVPLTQLADDPCTYLTTRAFDDCVDGGYHRKVIATGQHSCENLELEDNLGIFNWICSTAADPVFFYSTGMKSGKGLKDILNASSFKDNFVSLKKNAMMLATSNPATWWTNTVSPIALNSGGADPRISLSSSGTIYTVNSVGTSRGITINANRVGLVILSNSLTSTNPSSGDCDSQSGGTQECLILIDNSGDLSRIEGDFIGTSNLTGTIQFGGFLGNNISLVTINNSNLVGSGGGSGICSSVAYIPGLTLSNTKVSGFASNVNFNSGGPNKLVKNLVVSNATGNGFLESTGSWYSKYINITSTNNGLTGFSGTPWYSVFINLVITNNGSNGLNDFSLGNIFGNILVSGNSGLGFYSQLSFSTLKNATVVNNSGAGIVITGGNGVIGISNIITSNNDTGIQVGENNLKFSNLIISNNNTGIEFINSSTNGSFQNKLILGSNSVNCFYTSVGANPGLSGADCANQGASSATRVLGVSAVGYFQGKVTSESVNVNTTGLSVASSINDWINFQNPFRLWGFENAVDVLNGTKGRCVGASSCRVWDYRLLNTAGEAYNANGIFINGATCPLSVQGDVIGLNLGIAHLANAVEILFDRIGNDNGFCESNEECIFSPHIGYFQGEGDYTKNTCIFINGNGSNPVVGVKMYSYPNP